MDFSERSENIADTTIYLYNSEKYTKDVVRCLNSMQNLEPDPKHQSSSLYLYEGARYNGVYVKNFESPLNQAAINGNITYDNGNNFAHVIFTKDGEDFDLSGINCSAVILLVNVSSKSQEKPEPIGRNDNMKVYRWDFSEKEISIDKKRGLSRILKETCNLLFA
jgi:hypothetical protein